MKVTAKSLYRLRFEIGSKLFDLQGQSLVKKKYFQQVNLKSFLS